MTLLEKINATDVLPSKRNDGRSEEQIREELEVAIALAERRIGTNALSQILGMKAQAIPMWAANRLYSAARSGRIKIEMIKP